ncbi:MAG: hypothetical protein ACTSVI_04375 [Promethearchaeota archaeon]
MTSSDNIKLDDNEIKKLCEQLGLKSTKKYRILVQKLVKQVGLNTKKLEVALKKARMAH